MNISMRVYMHACTWKYMHLLKEDEKSKKEKREKEKTKVREAIHIQGASESTKLLFMHGSGSWWKVKPKVKKEPGNIALVNLLFYK